MSRKFALVSAVALVILSMMAISLQNVPVRAQGDATPAATEGSDDFPVLLEVIGTVVSVTPQNDSVTLIVLDDGTELLVNPATDLGGVTLEIGASITVQAS